MPQGQLSRGQRKRQAAKDRAAKRAELVAKMERGAKGDAGSAPYRMESLATMLDAAQSEQERAMAAAEKARAKQSNVKTHKTRKRVVAAAVRDFQAVLQHPQFQANPLATLDTHLSNTLGPVPEAAAATGTGAKAGAGSRAGRGSKR